MSKVDATSPKLDQPRRRTIWRKLRTLIWTIGIIAVLFAGLVLWIEYRKVQQAKLLANLRSAGVQVDSTPALYPWMRPLLTGTTTSFFESISPLRYDAWLKGTVANKDAIEKTLSLPNLVVLGLSDFHSLDDETVTKIAHLPSLRDLYLTRGEISDNGFGQLAGMSHLERVSVERVPLSENGFASLAKMNQLDKLDLGENDLDLIQGFSLEVTGPNGSKPIKVGDIVTFTGTFQSTKVCPTEVYFFSNQFLNGKQFAMSLAGPVSQLKDGTFQFALKAFGPIESPGAHTISLSFLAAGSPTIGFVIPRREINVADVAKPPSNPPQSPEPKKIEGKVEIKKGPDPK